MSAVLVRKAVKWKRSDKLTLVGRAVYACIWLSESSVLVGSTGHTFSFLYDFPCLAILALGTVLTDFLAFGALALCSVWVGIRALQDLVAVNALVIKGSLTQILAVLAFVVNQSLTNLAHIIR